MVSRACIGHPVECDPCRICLDYSTEFDARILACLGIQAEKATEAEEAKEAEGANEAEVAQGAEWQNGERANGGR